MVLSVKYEFIYFANARTATTSLESVLREFDDSSLLLSRMKEFRAEDPFLRAQNLKHIRPCQLKPWLEEDVWNRYYKFCFVRNPWDWCLSQFFRNHLGANKRLNLKLLAHPKALIKFLRRMRKRNSYTEFRDEDFERVWQGMKRYRGIESDDNYYQSQFVLDEEGRDVLDFVGHFESLEKDIRFVLERIGLDPEIIPERNKSRGKGVFTDYYTESTKQLVAERYARDIERLGYQVW